MVYEEISVDIRAILRNFFWNTEEIPKNYENVHPYFFTKHDITVLSSDYTNLFLSTVVKLMLEKEKPQKWIFEIQNNVFNLHTHANIYLNHTGKTTYCTLLHQ